MDLPDLTPEQRATVRTKAQERMRFGVAMTSEGAGRLTQAVENDDYAAMQAATGQMKEGLAQFDSGVAAERALAEGKAPRDVALQWFKQEMALSPPRAVGEPSGLFGLSLFHLAVMTVLIVFAAAMIWMYFHKMQRATLLLQSLTGDVVPAPAARAVPPAPTPPEPAAPVPRIGCSPGRFSEMPMFLRR